MEIKSYRDSSSHRGEDIDISERKIEKVTTGRKVKQSWGKELASELIADDLANLGHWFLHSVVIPSTKNILADGFNALLFGPDNNRYVTSGSNTIKRITPYSSLYSSSNRVIKLNDERDRTERRRGLANYTCQDVLIEYSRDESRKDTECRARDVLVQMRIYLQRYGYVSVHDFYDAVGEIPEKEDNNWGWYDLSGATLRANSEGIIIHMPRPESLD